MSYTLGQDLAFIIAHSDHVLAEEDLALFRASVARRAKGEPAQYITGRQEFFGLAFEVTPDVLIPRPETEIVVEAALDVLLDEPARIVDIGTGSGCIVVSLLDQLPDARAVATDTSLDALLIARRNAARHGVVDRLTLIQADGFSAFPSRPVVSLIVSNPPYVPESDIEGLQREVREHEPLRALVSGADGLGHIRDQLREAPARLRHDGHFIFEIGFGQREAVEKLIDLNVWKVIQVRNDLQNIARTFVLQKK